MYKLDQIREIHLELTTKCQEYINFMIENRNKIVKNVFNNKSDCLKYYCYYPGI